MKLIPSRANTGVKTVRCRTCKKNVTDGMQCTTSEDREYCPNVSVKSFYEQMKELLKP